MDTAFTEPIVQPGSQPVMTLYITETEGSLSRKALESDISFAISFWFCDQ